MKINKTVIISLFCILIENSLYASNFKNNLKQAIVLTSAGRYFSSLIIPYLYPARPQRPFNMNIKEFLALMPVMLGCALLGVYEHNRLGEIPLATCSITFFMGALIELKLNFNYWKDQPLLALDEPLAPLDEPLPPLLERPTASRSRRTATCSRRTASCSRQI